MRGTGPPANNLPDTDRLGWVRTGGEAGAGGSSSPWASCNAWTSHDYGDLGTVAWIIRPFATV